MRQIWTGRTAQAAAKYGEHAPMAAVCPAAGIAVATLGRRIARPL